jgi:hypothetical protein
MQPQNFEVGDDQVFALDGWKHLTQRRDMPAREDVLSDERVGRSRFIEAADRVKDGDAIVRK